MNNVMRYVLVLYVSAIGVFVFRRLLPEKWKQVSYFLIGSITYLALALNGAWLILVGNPKVTSPFTGWLLIFVATFGVVALVGHVGARRKPS